MTDNNTDNGPQGEAPTMSIKDMKKFERWRKSLQYLTGLGMSKEEQTDFRKALDVEIESYQCNQCENWRDNLMKNSPPVRFMAEHLEKVGRPISRDDFLCAPCDETRSGGFSPEHGILLCQNRTNSKTHQEHTMVHEMIHMYDHHRFKIDWLNLRHHACSEVRAASLSGDCNWSREFQRGFYTFTKQHQTCVRRRAILSVQENPSCHSREEAERAVASVFDSCFADTRPFDEIY
ncbi:peptidase M76 family-domain-containing protein [Syncephalastrum racemosum]|uniref:Mitochondrial inner membrane protease ATP23 n=1 Tax=Syncephalastrum racemosum TaxID=13706 RepID=A0A1X2HQA9_SYNRA|nr:peptidase M76 family-domain-containing protein [Syncephalastrum racemosum]